MGIKISAIICTHNRSAYLEKAIRSLIDQTLPKEQYEIIVVDNASTDSMREIVERFQARYIYEPILGLSQARNTGWQAAKGEYVAYLDDDAIAAPQWLEKILDVFENIKPRPGCVGGRIEPMWGAERPAWLSDKMLGQLTILDWGSDPKFLDAEQWIAGANMAFPGKLLEEIGGFCTNLGRKGAALLSMEENMLRMKINKKGYGCFYEPGAVVKHHILPERLTKKWFLDRAYWNGASNALMDMYFKPVSLFQALIKSFTTLVRVLLSFKELFCFFIPADNPARFQAKCSVYARLGYIITLCKR